MTTAVLSDLHLGARTGTDLLRRSEVRRTLLAAVQGVERVVLLGDVLELRQRPVAEVLDAAREFFEELGESVGDGQVVIVPGNHDHLLAEPLLERVRLNPAQRLGLEAFEAPGSAGPLAAIAGSLGRPELLLAYPGLWLRPDVYATHGHYLDRHFTVPTFERVAVALVERVAGRVPPGTVGPQEYEAGLAPLYAFIYNLAQAARPGQRVPGTNLSTRLWARMHPPHGGVGVQAQLLRRVALPTAIAALNRAGLGPFRADLSTQELRAAGLRAMSEVVTRLGIDAAHVVFGHTHSAGPLRDASGEWVLPGGTRLTNTGSWVYEPALLGDAGPRSSYWPGACVFVGEDGPPELRRLLDEPSAAALVRHAR